MWGLLNELPEDLTTRKAFQQNTREATFTSTAAEDQAQQRREECVLGVERLGTAAALDREQQGDVETHVDDAQRLRTGLA